jgi:hypothetical protein
VWRPRQQCVIRSLGAQPVKGEPRSAAATLLAVVPSKETGRMMRAPRLVTLLAGGALASVSVLVPISAAHAVPAGVTVSPSSPFNFDNCDPANPGTCQTRLGHFRLSGDGGEQELVVTNHSGKSAQVSPDFTTSNGSTDFLLAPADSGTSCLTIAPNNIDLVAVPIADTASCNLGIAFVPTHFGARATSMTVTFTDTTANKTPINSTALMLSGTGVGGYYLAGSALEWATFGFFPVDLENQGADLNQPVVGIAGDATGNGFWVDAADGGVFAAGDAKFFGSTGGIRLNQPVVGMAGTPSGQGYWLAASDGGIFNYGDAKFFGSTGNVHLNKPIVGMAATPTGKGYWLVASDGGIFAFGDAKFFGSTGNVNLNKPVVGMAATPTGQGYWLVASDGGIFAYGDARFFGSTGGVTLAKPIVGMSPSPTSLGYYLVASDGGIFNYGDVPFEGGLGGEGIDDVIGMTPTTLPLFGAFLVAPESVGARSRSTLAAISSGRLTPDLGATAR